MNLLTLTIAKAEAGGLGALLPMLIYLGVVIAFFYFIAIRPQKKQEREHEALVSSVETGDSILTSSGFYGVVIDVMDEVVIVEFGNNKNCRIPMKKAAILEVEKPEQDK